MHERLALKVLMRVLGGRLVPLWSRNDAMGWASVSTPTLQDGRTRLSPVWKPAITIQWLGCGRELARDSGRSCREQARSHG